MPFSNEDSDSMVCEEAHLRDFKPVPPQTLQETGLNEILIEDLILKWLFSNGVMSGRAVASTLCLPFSLLKPILADLKNRILVEHKSTTGVGDFLYALTDLGREKGLVAMEYSAYVGPAPVPMDAYLTSVEAQSIRNEQPGEAELLQAFSDLLLPSSVFEILGPAVNSGRGLFLYGAPGNGKTSIAERICRCFGDVIYLPKALLTDGQLIKLYDPQCHQAIETQTESLLPSYDQRWVLVQRPVVMVGGELTMESLEIKFNPILKISEAPLQLKANCGVFLIDDFGRQRISHEELLNRWIVPLEKRVDYLSLPNGKKIEVPFDELIIFSTNLDPAQLVDDAFLRRIPYKIHVADPEESAFKALMRFMAPRYGIIFNEDAFEHLVAAHYRGRRPYRACQARDLLEQIVNAAAYARTEPLMTPQSLDGACRNYFAAMSNLPDERV
ncbi:MAG: AAA family ATPase [Vampirovibrionales bacterium]|nr:AAA family ATPase [Vampirovibrionales bacterium]